MHTMSYPHPTRGRAFYGDSSVPAANVTVIERFDQSSEDVPLAGGRTGYKDTSGPDESSVIFDEIHDDELRALLRQIADASGSGVLELRRKRRDSGLATVVVDIVLDGERPLHGSRISSPLNHLGELETLEFRVALKAVSRQ